MPARRKSGFTLIELLVVIAIIAILAAILFPVFARAREAARKSTCQNNIKECALALNTYWNDYDAKIPSATVAASNASSGGTFTPPTDASLIVANFLSGCDSTGYAGGTNKNHMPPSALSPRVTWAQILYNNMKSKDIMYCPSDSAKDSSEVLSYWWKAAADMAWRNLDRQKESDFVYNSDDIILYEHAGFHSGEGNGIKGGVQINCAFLDTHVKTLAVPNQCAPTSNLTNGWFTSATSLTATPGEPMFYNYNNDTNVALTMTSSPAITVSTIDPLTYSDHW